MTRNPVVIDIAAGIAIAVVILIVEPGVAIGAILALLLLIVCAASALLHRRRARRARRTGSDGDGGTPADGARTSMSGRRR